MPDTPESRAPETVIAFDFGLARIGAAVGQAVTGSAGPAGVIANTAAGPDWRRIEALVAKWRPDRLIVGLPLNADGSPSPLSQAASAFAADLGRHFRLPVECVDERYTSLEARERLVAGRRAGRRGRIRRPLVDAGAAVLIAERWLGGGGAVPPRGTPPPADCG